MAIAINQIERKRDFKDIPINNCALRAHYGVMNRIVSNRNIYQLIESIKFHINDITISHRSELQSRLEQVILLDPDLSNRHNVEQTLWKAGFYQVIEVLRKQLSEERDEKLKTVLLSLLEEVSFGLEKKCLFPVMVQKK